MKFKELKQALEKSDTANKKLQSRNRWLSKELKEARAEYTDIIHGGMRRMGNFKKPFSQRVGFRFPK